MLMVETVSAETQLWEQSLMRQLMMLTLLPSPALTPDLEHDSCDSLCDSLVTAYLPHPDMVVLDMITVAWLLENRQQFL